MSVDNLTPKIVRKCQNYCTAQMHQIHHKVKYSGFNKTTLACEELENLKGGLNFKRVLGKRVMFGDGSNGFFDDLDENNNEDELKNSTIPK